MSITSWLFGNAGASPDQSQYQIGGLAGMNQQAQNGMNRAQNQAAPTSQAATTGAMQNGQAAQLNGGQFNQAYGMQNQLAQQLQRVASGQQQGAGELATQRQGNNAMAGQQAMANMARGANGASGAGLAAARNMGTIGTNVAGQAQQAALSDQQNAQAQLGNVTNNMAGNAMNFAGQNANLAQQMGLANMGANNNATMQNAQFGQQTNLANQSAQLQQNGMNNQASLAYLQQLYAQQQGQVQDNNAYQQAVQGQGGGAFGSLLQAGGALGAAAITHSDRNLKHSLSDATEGIDAMLRGLRPYSYRYKDDKHGAGERVGIMAQDLESSPLGSLLVVEAPDGKAIDLHHSVGALLACVARLNERIDQLEAA